MSGTVATWVDGRILQGEGVDPGLLYGLGVFETILVTSGRLFGMGQHFQRMAEGARRLGLPPPDRGEVWDAVHALVAQAPAHRTMRLRITWTPGASGGGHLSGILAEYAPQDRVRVALSRDLRNDRSPMVGVKATAYAENLLALREARAGGADEPLFANTRGELAEGATSNVFIERDGRILTPPLSSGCLPGTTRHWCLAWGRRAGLPIEEVPIRFSVMSATSHMVVTSALKGVAEVVSVDGRPLRAGPLLSKLREVYDAGKQEALRAGPDRW